MTCDESQDRDFNGDAAAAPRRDATFKDSS